MSSNSEHFLELWLAVVHKYPQQTAISYANQSTSYAQLYDRVQSLAAVIAALNLPAQSAILVDIDKSDSYVLALLAIWWNGHYFVSVSSDIPLERKKQIIASAKPCCMCLDYYDGSIDLPYILTHQRSDARVAPCIERHRLAYVFFTSGSSGHSKGVAVSHRGLSNVLMQQINFFGLHPQSRSLFYLSILFDASVSDIGTALLSGAALFIPTKGSVDSIDKLQHYLLENKISYVDIPPVILGLMDASISYTYLKTIVVGGEVISPATVEKWRNKVRLVVVYGPTEASICTSMVCCSSIRWTHNFIGMPIDGIRYRIGPNNELFIQGEGLALGYLDNPVLSASKFIQLEGKRWYRSGDKVSLDLSGQYIFEGRIDRQFKINGQLVAPEEIETVLKNLKEVTNAVVVKEANKIIAYLNGSSEFVEVDQINTTLKALLPPWMIPSRYILIDRLATKVTGKTNLSTPIQDAQLAVLKSCWQEVLAIQSVPILVSFESLGGSSLDRMRVLALAAAQGLQISAPQFGPTATLYDLWKSSQTIVHSKAYFEDHLSQLKKRIFVGHPTSPQAADATTHILLTGATGFLGSHLVVQLINITDKIIVCLVLCQSQSLGKYRLMAILTKIKKGLDYQNRLRVIPADLTKPTWGIAAVDRRYLATHIGQIFHAAAWISNMGSLQKMLEINVLSLTYLFELMQQGCSKELHYVSTLSVFVGTDMNGGICMETQELPPFNAIYGAYAPSKWMAEQLIFEAQKNKELSIKLYRLGLLTGDSTTGRSSAKDLFGLFVRDLVKLSAVSSAHLKQTIDITPVNFAAKTLVQLAFCTNPSSSIYHIANPQSLSLEKLVSILNTLGFPIQIMSNTAFESYAKANQATLLMAIANHENKRLGVDLFQATGFQFDLTKTKNDLGRVYNCPEPSLSLLKKYLDFYLTH